MGFINVPFGFSFSSVLLDLDSDRALFVLSGFPADPFFGPGDACNKVHHYYLKS